MQNEKGKIKMKMNILALCFLTLCLFGCKTSEQLAKNLNTKNISGSGFVTKSKIGMDMETMTPTIDTLFVSGNFKTVKASTNFIDLIQEETASVFNASAKTTKKHLTVTLDGKADVAKIVEILLEYKEQKNED